MHKRMERQTELPWPDHERWTTLPPPARQEATELLARMLLAIVKSERQEPEERTDEREDH